MASSKTAVGAADHGDERCPNCGACKTCGHGGVKFVPMPYPMPYPVPQMRPFTPPYTGTLPWRWPYTAQPPLTWGTGQISGATSVQTGAFTQTFNA